ncbi:MAG TPA: phenylalanine--tRNA ligase subunit alpha [Candidatus Acidoferrales bacterium]|nr:phenylalanine--tRNA ligase subunit alpha [Candidatus Acidoferrales bacterium]
MKEQTTKTLAELGAQTAEQLAALFAGLRAEFEDDAAAAGDESRWKTFRDEWMGRKSGVITNITENWLKKASSPEMKKATGQALNEFRAYVESVIEERRQAVETATEQLAMAKERVDLSLPGVMRPVGTRHPIRQTFEQVERIFLAMGYQVVVGPEIETPYYNFEALNIPEFHPARDNMDTFYMQPPAEALRPGGTKVEPRLLRTHTSPMQIRTMEKQRPPVRIIVPGRVYRRDNPDATHSFAFHQVEGLAVDTDLTFCDFAGTIDYFIREFFGPGTKSRFRPSYFPFTEPSVEFDASCIFCGGSGVGASGANCGKCKGSGWIELFGAGMVDPAVYSYVKYDATKLSGFAFGIGIDRLAMLKFGIEDLQIFFQNDVRFLRQFP